MAKEQQTRNSAEFQTRNLPKNFRQIGEPGSKKIYMEDYVYTYLNKLAQPGNLYARGAILFGKVYNTSAGKCLFISGAAACQNFEFDLENSIFTEENWSDIYRIRDTFFPEMEIAGWFLSRMGFSVDLNDKIIRIHMDNFSGENKVLYMIDALDNEDAFYQFENYALKKQKGYYIYYETNKEMKNYMLEEKETESKTEDKRKSATVLRDASVVKNYKKVMKNKKALKKKNAPKFGPASLAGMVAMILVLLYGLRSVQQFRQQENVAEVFQSQALENQELLTTEDISEGDTSGDEGESSASEEGIGTGTVQVLDNDGNDEEGNGMTGGDSSVQNDGDSSDNIDNGGNNEMTSENAEDDGSSNVISGGIKNGSDDDGADVEDGSDTEIDVFTQEEPDDVVESFQYIGSQYIVEQGDTLAGISKKIYQSYSYVDLLAEANNIENLDEIYPGQVLYIPPIED